MSIPLDILDDIRIASPCTVSWSSMAGDAQVRHCGECRLNVYNLSEMTRETARRLIAEKEGRLCVRLYRRKDGTVITADCPRGLAAKLRRKARRITAAVAAMFGVAVTGCRPLVCMGAPVHPLSEKQENRQQGREKPNADPTKKIDSFQGEYRFLSNFWLADVIFEGIAYPSVEHAYQAAKALDISERRRIAGLQMASEAKSAGRALPLRTDWEQVKFEVMEACVRDKFTRNAELGDRLLATGDAHLEEGNTWGDRVWGVYDGEGENRLGKILMKVRDELRGSPDRPLNR